MPVKGSSRATNNMATKQQAAGAKQTTRRATRANNSKGTASVRASTKAVRRPRKAVSVGRPTKPVAARQRTAKAASPRRSQEDVFGQIGYYKRPGLRDIYAEVQAAQIARRDKEAQILLAGFWFVLGLVVGIVV